MVLTEIIYYPPPDGDNTGDDIFQPLLGIDEVDGGDGEDILVIDYSSNTFAGGNGYNPGIVTNTFNDDGSGSFSGNLYAYEDSLGNYDQVSFSKIERFSITGTNFNDYIRVGWNNDTVNSGAGDDTIERLEGIDSIDGGAGIDTINYANLADATNNLTINSSGAIITTSNGTVVKNVEQFINLYTGSGNDNIAFTGRFSNTIIDTGNGNDTINSGLGDDNVYGGNGTDTLIVDYSSNAFAGTADYPAGISSEINFNGIGSYNGYFFARYDSSGNYDAIDFWDIEKFIITGTGKNDYFARGGNTITIDGGAGVDTIGILDLSVETANLNIDNSGATITQANGTIVKNVEQFINLYTGGGNDNIAFTGRFSNTIINTGNGNDTINSGLGIDNVYGGNGTDTLIVDYSSNAFAGTTDYPSGIASEINFNGFGSYNGYFFARYDSSGNYDQIYFYDIEKFIITGTGKNDYFARGGNTITIDGGAGVDTIGILDLSIETVNLTIDNTGATITQGNGTVVKNVEEFRNLYTGSGNDNIAFTGRFNNDEISINNGNDTINAGLGRDNVYGGNGIDTLIVDYSSNGFAGTTDYPAGIASEINFNGIGSYNGYFFARYDSSGNYDQVYFYDIEKLVITGTTKNDYFARGGDTITIDGGAGVDTIGILDLSVETVNLTIDNTGATITQGNGTVVKNVEQFINLYTGSGNDNIAFTGRFNNDRIDTSNGNDTINGGLGRDNIYGGNGIDTLIVDYSSNAFAGGGGFGAGIVTDSFYHEGGGSWAGRLYSYYNATGAYDQVDFYGIEHFNIKGTSAGDVLYGGSGSDTLIGNAGNDLIESGAGNDILDGGAGTDILKGGKGNDTYINPTGDNITELMGEGIDMVESNATFTLNTTPLANVENLILTGTSAINGTGNAQKNYILGNTGNNTLDGGTNNDTLVGDAGNDSLVGGTGNDSLDGGVGNDTLVGGTGNDTYVVDVATDVIIETSTVVTEIDTVQSSVNYTLSANLENLILTGSAITGTGNTTNNSILGNSLNNSLNGGAGDDTLDGSLGNDTLIGSTGNDVYVIDSVGDVVTETSTTATEIDTVQSSITYTLGANLENLTLTGTTAINGTGNSLNNYLMGNSGNNTLTGLDGNDSLDGGIGNDSLVGGTGNDVYIVDSTTDVVTETSTVTTEIDTVQSSVTYTLSANVENLTLTGENAINGTGNTLDNTIIGNSAANNLNGGAGNDTLNGGSGEITLLTDNFNTENGGSGTDNYNNFANWNVTDGTVDLFGPGFGDFFPGNGLYLDLDGSTGNAGKLESKQTFNFSAGDVITLQFSLAGSQQGNTNSATVSLGSLYTETFTRNSDAPFATITRTITVSANGTGKLIFDNAGGDNEGLLLDNVSLTKTNGDSLIGGTGNDFYIINSTTDVISETSTVATEIDTVQSSFSYTLTTNVENLILVGTNAINGTGNTLANNITGNGGNNSLSGNDGNDTLNSGNGADTLNGGNGADSLIGGVGVDSLIGGVGNDIYVVDNTGDKVSETSTTATEIDTVQSSVTWTLGANLEKLSLTGTTAINGTGNTLNNTILGNDGINTLSGGDGNDTLDGGIGNDSLVGGNGADSLIGGVGNDTLNGGTGNDVYDVDSITDVIQETSTTTTEIDTVKSSVNYTLSANLENLILTGITGLSGTGNTLSNVITGNIGNDTLNGGIGNDNLNGGDGNDSLMGADGNDNLNGGIGADTLMGGVGNDVYILDNIGDTIIELTGEGTDSAQSSVSLDFSGIGLENLTLTGIDNVNATGNTSANSITGNVGSNILTGGAGNDTLTGNNGIDRFVGGEGNDILNLGLGDAVTDTLIYNPGDGSDTVNQFALGIDKFAFVGLVNVDVITSGTNTQFRLGNGVEGDVGFGSGSILFSITGVNTFNTGNIASSVDASNTASFLFS